MREQVEDRLKFFETGELPPKNVDVMREAVKEFFEIQVSFLKVAFLKLQIFTFMKKLIFIIKIQLLFIVGTITYE